jgi:hypothetical protein
VLFLNTSRTTHPVNPEEANQFKPRDHTSCCSFVLFLLSLCLVLCCLVLRKNSCFLQFSFHSIRASVLYRLENFSFFLPLGFSHLLSLSFRLDRS